jgi:membrane-bound lytic murein transglycosylase B
MSDPVLQYAGLAKAAEHETGVPASILLGLTSVESAGNIHAVSKTGAFGLTQFEPSTAATYHVVDGDPRSQIFGAARYLRDLGYHANPSRALAMYNGGPANPQYGYASTVIARARSYGNPTIPSRAPTSAPKAPQKASGDSGDVLGSLGDKALYALLWGALAIAGAALIGLGAARASGLRQPHGAIA